MPAGQAFCFLLHPIARCPDTKTHLIFKLTKKDDVIIGPQESLDVDMSDKRMNAEIQKGRNSSLVPAASADFSDCPYRLAEREW